MSEETELLRKEAIRALYWCIGFIEAKTDSAYPPTWIALTVSRLVRNDPYWEQGQTDPNDDE